MCSQRLRYTLAGFLNVILAWYLNAAMSIMQNIWLFSKNDSNTHIARHADKNARHTKTTHRISLYNISVFIYRYETSQITRPSHLPLYSDQYVSVILAAIYQKECSSEKILSKSTTGFQNWKNCFYHFFFRSGKGKLCRPCDTQTSN